MEMLRHLGWMIPGAVLAVLGGAGMALVVAISVRYAACTSMAPYVTGCSPANPATAEFSLILLLAGVLLLIVGFIGRAGTRGRPKETPQLGTF